MVCHEQELLRSCNKSRGVIRRHYKPHPAHRSGVDVSDYRKLPVVEKEEK
jgi:hypothetical protein